jgi:hypothetical protein
MDEENPSTAFKRTMTKYNSRFGKFALEDIKDRPLYTRKPLTKRFQKKANDYVHAHCRFWELEDVDIGVQCLIESNLELTHKGEHFTSDFDEYVLLEVRTKNRMKLIPCWNLPMRFCYYSKLVFIRWDCRLRSSTGHGATPRYHAKIFRKEINDELIKQDMYFAVPVYYHNKKDVEKDPFCTENEKRRDRLCALHERRGREIMKKLEQE